MQTKLALITGASRGLGRSMALHLARAGADIIGTFHSREDEANNVVREIEALGRRAAMLRLDVSDSSGLADFVSRLGETARTPFGRARIDMLVNNAGVGAHAPIEQTTEAQLDAMIRIHFRTPFLLTQALLPLIEDGGRILNVSTGLARFTIPGFAAYAAAKGATEVFTRYLARELGPRRITANVVAPGAIETDFGGGMVRDDPAMNQAIAQSIALGRAGQPDDVGAAVAMLLSDEAGWINGTRIEVSGGQNL